MRGCAVDIRCMGVEHALRMMVILLDIADQKRQDFVNYSLKEKPSRAVARFHSNSKVGTISRALQSAMFIGCTLQPVQRTTGERLDLY